ncbi:cysteine hydrolase family protein [Acidisoma sp. 7E03]
MPVTTLDPRSALVVIDLQKGIVALPVSQAVEPIIEKARRLADAFRARGLPVVWVNVTGGAPGRNEQPTSTADLPADWAELVPALGAQPGDHRVTKKTWGAFTGTDLHDFLQAKGVTQIVLLGVATSIGVESTARFAQELGYNITLVTDAMADLRPEAHENSIARIFPRLGERGTAEEVLALLPPMG